jgi:hypothetical protein
LIWDICRQFGDNQGSLKDKHSGLRDLIHTEILSRAFNRDHASVERRHHAELFHDGAHVIFLPGLG